MRGVGNGFAGAAYEDLLLTLMIEVNVEDGGAAMIPDLFGDGEVEEDHAFGGLAGADHSVAEEGIRRERLETRKRGVDVLEVEPFDSAGGDLFAFRCGEGRGEVLEEEREMEAVVDTERGEDVESVFCVLVADHDGVRFEDGVGGIDGGAGDTQVRCSVWGEAQNQGENNAKNEERQEDRHQQVSSSGLSELEVGHWDENSKGLAISERLKDRRFNKCFWLEFELMFLALGL